MIVWPELEMVVVIMAGGNPGERATMVGQAVKSEQALPTNAAAAARLNESMEQAKRSRKPGAVSAMPELAASISGAVYDFPVNPSRIDSLSVTFAKGGEARLDVKYYGRPLSFPIGLDG